MKYTDNIKGLLVHLAIILVILTISVLVFFYFYLPNHTNHGETIIVPNLYERNIDELAEMLEDRGLTYEVSDSVYVSKYPPLTILHQYPKAGSEVKEGRKIFLSVNRNSVPKIPVPDYTDKSIIHYRAILENTDIKIEKITAKKNPYEIVLDVIYKGKSVVFGDTIPKGSEVEIVVGDGYGKTWTQMVDLFGYEYESAYIYTKGANLNLEPLKIPSGLDTTNKTLYVNRQEPLPGDTIHIGEWITLWVDVKLDSSFYKDLHKKTEIDTSSIKSKGSNQ
ncbi:MAG: PASTA domain-containing protein [Cyclobacteriaceae bacterium]|nr:PASTA domain-containing protein [Cyclobacteriaceae bacterium]